jgi:outer membrane beta-barrel protein
MKRFGLFALTAYFLIAATASSGARAEISLEDELKKLSLPDNQAPAGVASEKLYAVQTRFAPLRRRSEFSLGGGRNFTPDSFISSTETSLTYRYHFSDRFSLGVSSSAVFNSMTDTGQRIMNGEGYLPDSAYVRFRGDLIGTYNLFYGKFRLSMEQVFYFDNYIALGPTWIVTDRRGTPGVVGEIGFAFWLGRSGSIRVGLKDYLYRQERRVTSGLVNDLVGTIGVGYLLGGGES